MEIRHTTNPTDFKYYTTERIRNDFLIENLFVEGESKFVYTHYDRFIIGGAVPIDTPLELDVGDQLKTNYFLERREVGVINIGGPGVVKVETEEYVLDKKDGLYIGLGNKNVTFHSVDPQQPARFYIVSSHASKRYPTEKIDITKAEPARLGSNEESNKHTIYKYIHADGARSCQLMMGLTILEPNNMWNTMPAHLHDRRMEAYLYFDLEDTARVFHLMGEPQETRHIVVKNEQAIISPSWSIHSGVGTSNYTFIWAMAGENYTFADMDVVEMDELK